MSSQISGAPIHQVCGMQDIFSGIPRRKTLVYGLQAASIIDDVSYLEVSWRYWERHNVVDEVNLDRKGR